MPRTIGSANTQRTAVATAPNPGAGNAVALASGVAYALTLAGLRWLSRHGGGSAGIAAASYGNVVACLATLPMALPARSVTGIDVAVLLYLGIFQIGLAYVCLTRAMR